ncbi:hypothetical protein TKK_0016199 [Trichogramma kaykai]|uniref:Ion transport domain-containing protein n=1 Tax=Trichogramma kaykai TaxID=54128 RepID=A0ABD2W890_9HYME
MKSSSAGETWEMRSREPYARLLKAMQDRRLANFKAMIRKGLAERPATIDVNYLIPDTTLKRLLDKAAAENLPDFVESLLGFGADPNLVNPELDRAPIHFAAENGSDSALAVLLKDKGIQPNLEAPAGQTALHYAVRANSERCVELLIEAQATPNIPNVKGLTALHMAAQLARENMVRFMIEHAAYLDIDTYKDPRRKETARATIERQFPNIKLPAPNATVSDPSRALFHYLTANDPANFERTLEAIEGTPEGVFELLKKATRRGLTGPLDQLLRRFAPGPAELVALAELAIKHAWPEVLDRLLKLGAREFADQLLMPASQALCARLEPRPAQDHDAAAPRFRCLELVLEQENVDVRQQDDKGNSPLHYATRASSDQGVQLLLEKGAYIGHRNVFGESVLDELKVEQLEKRFNECLESSKEDTEDFEIVIDYRNLVPHGTHCLNKDDYDIKDLKESQQNSHMLQDTLSEQLSSETDVCVYLSERKNLRHLLTHPLLASFLQLKYQRVRHLIYINLFFYLVYFVSLFSFIWVTGNEETPSLNATSTSNEPDNLQYSHPLLSTLFGLSLCYLIVRETLQFVSSPLQYLTTVTNWLELTLVGASIALLLGGGPEISAVAILLSTWELVLLISPHPRSLLSSNLEMFKTVTANFTKFLLLYILLLMAFAMAFFQLFRSQDDSFATADSALFRTIVMFTGEFDATGLPFSNSPFSRFVFVSFIFFAVIILLNIFTGVAVNDAAEILAEAEIVGLVARTRVLAYVDQVAVGGPPAKPANCCCCCYRPEGLARLGLFRRLIRRVLLFPCLPQARISVQPFNESKIRAHGMTSSMGRMEPMVVRRAKEILADRENTSAYDRMVSQVKSLEHIIGHRLGDIEKALNSLAATVNSQTPSRSASPSQDA